MQSRNDAYQERTAEELARAMARGRDLRSQAMRASLPLAVSATVALAQRARSLLRRAFGPRPRMTVLRMG